MKANLKMPKFFRVHTYLFLITHQIRLLGALSKRDTYLQCDHAVPYTVNWISMLSKLPVMSKLVKVFHTSI